MFSLYKKVLIQAPPSCVFSALTEPEQIVTYYPVKSVTADKNPGGAITLRGEMDGEAFTDYGVIEILSPATEFAYRYWSDNHGTDPTPENYMRIHYRLTPSGQGTLVTVEHTNLLTQERHTMMDEVWDYLLGQLKRHVEEGEEA